MNITDVISPVAEEIMDSPYGELWLVSGVGGAIANIAGAAAVAEVALPIFLFLSGAIAGMWVGRQVAGLDWTAGIITALLIGKVLELFKLGVVSSATNYLAIAMAFTIHTIVSYIFYSSISSEHVSSILPAETFDDVVALGKSKEKIQEIASYLKDPTPFTALGARPPRGIILAGPPGTGKTLIAKALAHELGPYTSFLQTTGPQLKSKWMSETAENVRHLFDQAKSEAGRQNKRLEENAKVDPTLKGQKGLAIIFIDEIDSFGERGGGGPKGQKAYQDQIDTINEMLAQMDGFTPLENVIVIGTTNSIDRIDEALIARFPYRIETHLPDQKEREAIFAIHLQKVICADDIDLEKLALYSSELSGRDIKHIVENALWRAGTQKQNALGQNHLVHALGELKQSKEESYFSN